MVLRLALVPLTSRPFSNFCPLIFVCSLFYRPIVFTAQTYPKHKYTLLACYLYCKEVLHWDRKCHLSAVLCQCLATFPTLHDDASTSSSAAINVNEKTPQCKWKKKHCCLMVIAITTIRFLMRMINVECLSMSLASKVMVCQ